VYDDDVMVMLFCCDGGCNWWSPVPRCGGLAMSWSWCGAKNKRLAVYEDAEGAKNALQKLSDTELDGRKIYLRKVGGCCLFCRVVRGGGGVVRGCGSLGMARGFAEQACPSGEVCLTKRW